MKPSDPQSSVTIESSSLPQSLPPEIYLGPDSEVLPPGLILIEEELQEETTPSTPTHFGSGLHLYHYFPRLTHSAPIDPFHSQIPIDSLQYFLGYLTMEETTSQNIPYVTAVKTSIVASSLMFSTTPKSDLYGGLSVPLGYKAVNGTYSGVYSSPWTSLVSSSRILSSSSLMSTEWPDPQY